MKKDCNKLASYIAERERMCASFDSCTDCPLNPFYIPCGSISKSGDCKLFEKLYPFEARSIIQKWSDAHQQKTYAENFFEKFPNALRSQGGCPNHICVKSVYGADLGCNCRDFDDCDDCWLQVMEDEPSE